MIAVLSHLVWKKIKPISILLLNIIAYPYLILILSFLLLNSEKNNVKWVASIILLIVSVVFQAILLKKVWGRLLSLSIVSIVFIIYYSGLGLIGYKVLQPPSFCNDEIVEVLGSPSGNYKAVAYIRNCGATTDYVALVVLTEQGKDLSDIGSNDFVFIGNHSYFVDIEWLEGGVLSVIHETADKDIIQQTDKKFGISIRYTRK